MWLAIDYHKGKRKRQDGKETVVYVNGVAPKILKSFSAKQIDIEVGL